MTGYAANGGGRGGPWRIVGWGGAGLLLLMPLIAMQFTDEVNWDETDFIVMGAMICFVGLTLELAVRMTGNLAYRAAVAVALAAAFLLIWINLAVGIIGSEDNPANLMYVGVLAIVLVGAALARFRPGGMARAIVGAALAHVVIAAVALLFGLGSQGANWPQVIFVLNGFFAALWLLSAWLFRRAAGDSGRRMR
jgi:hypothetical protein